METTSAPARPGGWLSTERAEPELWLQKILVPVDFSAGSTVALQYAAALARQYQATVTLLHVVQLSIVGEERGIPRAQFLQEMAEAGERQIRSLIDTLWGSEISREVLIKTGCPCEEILRTAQETQTDLIIVASHGDTGLLRWLRPHTAERVLHYAPCPVLVLRATQQPFVLQLPRVP